jgi:hypothetical protein
MYLYFSVAFSRSDHFAVPVAGGDDKGFGVFIEFQVDVD